MSSLALHFHLSSWFRAAFGVALLHDGLGINIDDASLLFTDTITSKTGQSIVLDWTLGEHMSSQKLLTALLIC